jgi:hypothetical protein
MDRLDKDMVRAVVEVQERSVILRPMEGLVQTDTFW